MIPAELESDSPSRTGPQFVFGMVWLLLAGVYNPWTFDWLLGSASLHTVTGERVVLALGVVFALLGFGTLLRPLTSLMIKVHLLLLMTFLVAPCLAEIGFRVAIHQRVERFLIPVMYADHYSDDDHWKLSAQWRDRQGPRFDAKLGWGVPSHALNPLGIHRKRGYEPQLENTVLCFGDSFTAGMVPLGQKIPDVIDAGLDGMVAYNFGVGGYGVDQMYLSYLEHQPQFEDPIIVVSIFTRDLDRSILRVRDRLKPYFRLNDGALTLMGVPVPEDREAWNAANPVELRSFFLSWACKRVWMKTMDGTSSSNTYRQEEKRVLNRAILKALVEDARSKDLRLLFVTYPPNNFAEEVDWRATFLAELFEELGAPWLDGEQVLRADMAATGRKPSAYFQEDTHNNALGNRLYGEATLEKLSELWDVPTLQNEH